MRWEPGLDAVWRWALTTSDYGHCCRSGPCANCCRPLVWQAVSEEAYAAVVCRHLRGRLVNHSARAFDRRMLEPALRYSASTPVAFLRLVLPEGVSGHGSTHRGCAGCVASDASGVEDALSAE